MIRGLDRRVRNLESIGRRIRRSAAGPASEFENLSGDELERVIREGLVRLGIMSDSDAQRHASRKSSEPFGGCIGPSKPPTPVDVERLSDDELMRGLRQRAVQLGFIPDSDAEH